MAHPLIENYTDYFVVLARTDSEPPKDERFITRAFASSSFDDEDSGDEGIQFKHEETALTLACDGEVVAIHHPASGNYEPALLMFGDLFLALQRMGWESVKLYCANDAEEILHQMASRLPATYSLDLSLAELQPTVEELDSLRQAIDAHGPDHQEPSFKIASLMASGNTAKDDQDQRWGQLPDVGAAADATESDRSILAPRAGFANAKSAAGQAPGIMEAETHERTAAHSADAFVGFEKDQYQRQLAARERETAELHEIIKQLLLRQNMEQFAAAVLPHDAILIAHLYAPTTSKLEALGFERQYNVFAHEEYGIRIDGAFMVFTRDVAAPDWIEKLLARLGGRIVRVWQSEASLVGTLLEQRMDASTPATCAPSAAPAIAEHDPTTHGLKSAVPAAPVGNLDDSKNEPAVGAVSISDDGLTPGQRAAIAAMNQNFSTIMTEVFKTSNETGRVAERVSALESTGVDTQDH